MSGSICAGGRNEIWQVSSDRKTCSHARRIDRYACSWKVAQLDFARFEGRKRSPSADKFSVSSRLVNRGGSDQLASDSGHKPDQGVSMQTGASSREFVCQAIVKADVVCSVSRVRGRSFGGLVQGAERGPWQMQNGEKKERRGKRRKKKERRGEAEMQPRCNHARLCRMKCGKGGKID